MPRAAAVAAAALAVGGAVGAQAAQSSGPGKITKVGTVDVRKAAAAAGNAPYRPALRNSAASRLVGALEERRNDEPPAPRGGPRGPKPPNVRGLKIASGEAQRGWEGQDIRDTVFSQGFEVEPPDQGLCVGTVGSVTFLWEEVNLSIALYDSQQNQYTPPALGLNALYDLPPAFDPVTQTFGPFLSDPKCYRDADTGRWFHTVLELDVDPATGDLTGGANTLLAVSASTDPLGPYTVYRIDATLPSCVLCLGDQPLLGADANGIYISTAEYDLDPPAGSPGFFGAQIYAIDKQALVSGAAAPTVVHIQTGTQFTGTVQPATTPSGRYETAQGGTEYFMSAQDCEPPSCNVDPDSLENTIHVWALTNTSSLRVATPGLHLLDRTLSSQVYGQPVPQRQKPGLRPLGESLGLPVPEVEANDARMNQVVYAAGRLWGGFNTIVRPGPRDGVAWFSVTPSVSAAAVNGTIARQGYVAGKDKGSFVTFPSIGVNDAGQGVIA